MGPNVLAIGDRVAVGQSFGYVHALHEALGDVYDDRTHTDADQDNVFLDPVSGCWINSVDVIVEGNGGVVKGISSDCICLAPLARNQHLIPRFNG